MNEFQNGNRSQSETLTWALRPSSDEKQALFILSLLPVAILLILEKVSPELYVEFTYSLIFSGGLLLVVVLLFVFVLLFGLACFVFGLRNRRLILQEDKLKYEMRLLGIPICDWSVSLDDLKGFFEFEDQPVTDSPFWVSLGEPSPMLVIIDDQERLRFLHSEHFSPPEGFEHFKDAFEYRLAHLDNLEHSRSNGEKWRANFHRRPYSAFVSFGFPLFVLAIFLLQRFIGNIELTLTAFRSTLLNLELLDMGGLFAPSIINGRWDRLFTSGLTHGDFLGLALVGLAIGVTGYALERHIGSSRTAIIIFVGLFAGSVTSLAIGFSLDSNAVFAGAWSGAFALFGARFFIFRPWSSRFAVLHRWVTTNYRSILMMSLLLLYLLVFQDWKIVTAISIAGLIAGVVTAKILLTLPVAYPTQKPSRVQRGVAIGLALVFVGGLLTSTYFLTLDDERQLERLAWVSASAQEVVAETEHREFMRSVLTATAHVPDINRRSELVAEAIRHTELSAEQLLEEVARTSARRLQCPLGDPDVDIWHESIAQALSAEEARIYREAIDEVCTVR